MPQYLLLLYDNPADFAGLSPAEMGRIFERYKAWRQGLRENGSYVGSNKLRDDAGRVVRRKGSDLRVTDGPFIETKEVLGGYFLIEADSYEQAIQHTRSCPHLDYGSIAVREVEFV